MLIFGKELYPIWVNILWAFLKKKELIRKTNKVLSEAEMNVYLARRWSLSVKFSWMENATSSPPSSQVVKIYWKARTSVKISRCDKKVMFSLKNTFIVLFRVYKDLAIFYEAYHSNFFSFHSFAHICESHLGFLITWCNNQRSCVRE